MDRADGRALSGWESPMGRVGSSKRMGAWSRRVSGMEWERTTLQMGAAHNGPRWLPSTGRMGVSHCAGGTWMGADSVMEGGSGWDPHTVVTN